MTRRHLFTTAAGAAIASVCPASAAPAAWIFNAGFSREGVLEITGFEGRRCLNRDEIIKHFGWEKGIPAGYAIGEPAT